MAKEAAAVVLVGRESGLGEEAGAGIEQVAPEAETADELVAAPQEDGAQQAAPEVAGQEQEEAPEHTLAITLSAPEN